MNDHIMPLRRNASDVSGNGPARTVAHMLAALTLYDGELGHFFKMEEHVKLMGGLSI